MITGDIFTVPLYETEPPAVTFDEKSETLDRVLADVLRENMHLTYETVGIYYRVSELTEQVCDMLASDLHVDWYNYEWSLDEKRRAIESTVAIHRKMGTVYSVKRALKIVATGDVDVEEWFDYDGEPYRFRVTVHENDHENPADIRQIIRAIYIYKPVRAHLGLLTLEKEPISTDLHLGTALTMKISSVSIPEL